jgi:hypothetical protein
MYYCDLCNEPHGLPIDCRYPRGFYVGCAGVTGILVPFRGNTLAIVSEDEGIPAFMFVEGNDSELEVGKKASDSEYAEALGILRESGVLEDARHD